MKKTCLMVVAVVGTAAVAAPGDVALREVVRGPDALAVSITTNAAGHAILDFGKHHSG